MAAPKASLKELQQTPVDLLMGMFTWTHALGFAVGTVLTEDPHDFRENWALWLSLVLLFNALFSELVVGTTQLRLLKEDSLDQPTSRIVYTVLVTVRLGLGWATVIIIRGIVAWTLESDGFMGPINLVNSMIVLYSVYVVLNPVPPSLVPDAILVPVRQATLQGAVPGTVPVPSLHDLTNIAHAPHDDVVRV